MATSNVLRTLGADTRESGVLKTQKYGLVAPHSFYSKKKDPIVRLGLKEGGDLLFHKCSTIGANGLNFSVRKGKR